MTRTTRPHLALALAITALITLFWYRPDPEPTTFITSAAVREPLPEETPFFKADLLPIAAPSAHAASLEQLPDGTLLAAWFAGSREGANDVAIYLSRWQQHGWSPPVSIATRDQTADELRRHIRKLGNPVLHVDKAGQLHLFFVSVSLGGWAGSAINHKTSVDGGNTWGTTSQLVTSPFFNISTLVRTPPLVMEDGSLGFPVYHEFIAKHGEWLRLGQNYQPVDKIRIPQARPALQPAVIASGPQHAIALMRDAGPGAGHILGAETSDGGNSWNSMPALPITNSNSSIALLKLDTQTLLLAGNPGPGRSSLMLYLSRDAGESWHTLGPVESSSNLEDKNIEYSYPSLLQDHQGSIHMVYTWNRKGIRHTVFNRAWINQRLSESPLTPAIREPYP